MSAVWSTPCDVLRATTAGSCWCRTGPSRCGASPIGAAVLRVNDDEAQAFLEDIEVAIAMEQRVLLADAVGCRQHVDGLANCPSGLSQLPVVVRCFRRERSVEEIDDLEIP